jgi:rhamnulokinase
MAERVYLAVDLGAESGRVIAGTLNDGRVSLEEVHRFANHLVNVAGTRRWDVLRLWTDIQDGLALAGKKYGDRIVSVGVDTWGVDYVLLSKSGEILGMPYNYRDPRTTGMLEHAFTKVPKADIFAQSGVQFMEINTLYQVISMQLKDPELMAHADRFLMMPDFFHWLLCGSRVVEFTNATTTQFLHPTNRDWSFDLLRKFNIPTSIFPEVVPPGTKLGTLRDDVIVRTGLKKIAVVAPATHDTGAAVAAVPTENTGKANWAYISSGTWSLIGVEVQDAILGPKALELNVTNEGGVDGTYRLLKNVMGLWLIQECRRSFERRGRKYEYAELVTLAQAAEPFRTLIDPNDHAFLSPDDIATSIEEWCRKVGEPVPETDGQFVRCCLESLAFKYRQVLKGIEDLTGVPIEVIHVVGGGGKNEILNQFTASASGKPVIAGPTEATALGNVLIQARASGDVGSLTQIRDVVRSSYANEMKTFPAQDIAAWDSQYPRFLKLLRKGVI